MENIMEHYTELRIVDGRRVEVTVTDAGKCREHYNQKFTLQNAIAVGNANADKIEKQIKSHRSIGAALEARQQLESEDLGRAVAGYSLFFFTLLTIFFIAVTAGA
jgi:hypothetical protein